MGRGDMGQEGGGDKMERNVGRFSYLSLLYLICEYCYMRNSSLRKEKIYIHMFFFRRKINIKEIALI